MSEQPVRDRLFATPRDSVEEFDFGPETARVFDDMLARSVPLYSEIQRMIAEIAPMFFSSSPVLYDLGCSTGTTIVNLARSKDGKNVRFIGIDNSAAMLERAETRLKAAGDAIHFQLQHANLAEPFLFEPHDVSIAVLTFQFLPPSVRESLICAIYASLRPGGGLLVVEKVVAEDSFLSKKFVDYYHDYKRRQGYSELEIAQKREALENVLVPLSAAQNVEMLRRAGFSAVEEFFRWYNFAGFVAVKPKE